MTFVVAFTMLNPGQPLSSNQPRESLHAKAGGPVDVCRILSLEESDNVGYERKSDDHFVFLISDRFFSHVNVTSQRVSCFVLDMRCTATASSSVGCIQTSGAHGHLSNGRTTSLTDVTLRFHRNALARIRFRSPSVVRDTTLLRCSCTALAPRGRTGAARDLRQAAPFDNTY